MSKKVSVYFYYLNVQPSRIHSEGPTYTMNDFVSTFINFLDALAREPLATRKHDFFADEKIIWLDGFTDLGNGNCDLIFKSAKYNQVRTVIDTTSMITRGTIKTHSDGDEEKTHLCVRYVPGRTDMICIHESNYYGVRMQAIVRYLNEKFDKYLTATHSNIFWTLSKEFVVCEDFLAEVDKMRNISLLKVTIDHEDLGSDFLRLADRNDDVKSTIDISIGKVKRNKPIPKELIRNYYAQMMQGGIIKRVVADGSNESGPIRLDTEAIKKKQSVTVETTPIGEVRSEDFFSKVHELILREV